MNHSRCRHCRSCVTFNPDDYFPDAVAAPAGARVGRVPGLVPQPQPGLLCQHQHPSTLRHHEKGKTYMLLYTINYFPELGTRDNCRVNLENCGNSILTYCRRVNIFCILTCHKSLTVAFTLVKDRWWRFLNVVIVPGKITKFVNVVIIQDCWRKCVWMSSLYPGQSDVQLDPGLVAPGRVQDGGVRHRGCQRTLRVLVHDR